ncbi:MAG TPA: hypothetical protein PLO23_05090 [Alphaproteobacteria bacterium]|nr:hypothetical protein [Alphaproteobacteria bacterium]
MGSLTSRPKVPQQSAPQVVYVPQPVYSAPAPTPSYTPPPASATTPAPTPQPTEEEQRSEARAQSLLTRDRSRYGTVTTSFRGLLNLATGGATKTLLGE